MTESGFIRYVRDGDVNLGYIREDGNIILTSINRQALNQPYLKRVDVPLYFASSLEEALKIIEDKHSHLLQNLVWKNVCFKLGEVEARDYHKLIIDHPNEKDAAAAALIHKLYDTIPELLEELMERLNTARLPDVIVPFGIEGTIRIYDNESTVELNTISRYWMAFGYLKISVNDPVPKRASKNFENMTVKPEYVQNSRNRLASFVLFVDDLDFNGIEGSNLDIPNT